MAARRIVALERLFAARRAGEQQRLAARLLGRADEIAAIGGGAVGGAVGLEGAALGLEQHVIVALGDFVVIALIFPVLAQRRGGPAQHREIPADRRMRGIGHVADRPAEIVDGDAAVAEHQHLFDRAVVDRHRALVDDGALKGPQDKARYRRHRERKTPHEAGAERLVQRRRFGVVDEGADGIGMARREPRNAGAERPVERGVRVASRGEKNVDERLVETPARRLAQEKAQHAALFIAIDRAGFDLLPAIEADDPGRSDALVVDDEHRIH